MYWFARYKYGVWSRYNYILAAAFNAGFDLNMLVLCLGVVAGRVGGSVERCFALERGVERRAVL